MAKKHSYRGFEIEIRPFEGYIIYKDGVKWGFGTGSWRQTFGSKMQRAKKNISEFLDCPWLYE